MADINVVAENLTELLTNTVNMTDVFYDLFINPTPKDVKLWQYDSNNQLVQITIPNRAKDRKIALTGTADPTNTTEAQVGTCYVNTATNSVFFKVRSTGNNRWLKLATQTDIDTAIATLQATIASDYVPVTRTVNGKALSSNISLDSSDVGAMSDDVQYAASMTFSNSILSLKDQDNNVLSSVELASTQGANTSLSNISADGELKLQATKGYPTGTEALTDTTLYTYIKGLYDTSTVNGTDNYEIEGSTVSIPYKLGSTGIKIVLSTYGSRVESLYDSQGYALYYVIDTTNHTVTLPMGEIFGFIGNCFHAIEEETDGGWNLHGGIEVSTVTAIGSYEVSLASYIPEDGYDYLCVFRAIITRNGNSGYSNSSILYTMPNRTGGMKYWLLESIDGGGSGSSTEANNKGFQFIGILAGGQARKIGITIGNKALSTHTLNLVAEKRLGRK